jgi:hypothetical protein
MFIRSLIAAAVAVAVNPAQAASIVEWDLLGAPGNQASTAASSAATNVTGLDLTRGSGLSGSGAKNSFSSTGFSGNDAGDYVEFGFSVDAGYSVDLDTLFIGTRSSNTGPGTLGLFSSQDGFSSSLFTFTQSGTAFNNQTVDLSALTGLTGTVNFRIYEIGDTQADGSGATANTGTFRVGAYFENGNFANNLGFSGTVNTLGGNPVPVPAAVWLLGSAVAGMAGVARRKAA